MARTTLPRRSGDIATAIQLTDRTGILAASAPPAADEPKLPELEAVSVPSTLVAASEPQRPVSRRVRRNLVFTCAAALFLVVGWIGGGTWGQHDSSPAPAWAVGAVADQEQGGTKPPAPTTGSIPAPVQPAPQAAPAGSDEKQVTAPAKRTTKATSKPAPTTKATAYERADTASSEPSPTAQSPAGSMTEQLQQMLDSWSRTGTTGYRVHEYPTYGR
ncbi:hypothetical protein LWP59_01100 [Amycolatopsis acidiphila]|uniref:Uncharacterized protein n=1 Tax=Amycolatopsis acidiphila TaxID=715473 RepID=A0A558AMT5_9PSEU|nr:hypothetical protein [Amycolatopsis acidiphila]TVT25577.1 hypothetical protein FNH06_01850 [Amycolatopsis acidiphila]UIJ60328.1 hypothetical protein LWP59_01100 [Amycolatopsis acidiphila]GHG90657.1 hypothetical protein GCM10017788_66470 [Amycolatopsis acidiphila]